MSPYTSCTCQWLCFLQAWYLDICTNLRVWQMCRTDVRSLVTLDQILYEIVSCERVHISVDGWQSGCRAVKLIKILIYCNKLYQKYSTILNSNNKAFFSIFVFFCWMLICILYWRILRLLTVNRLMVRNCIVFHYLIPEGCIMVPK